MMPMLGGGCPNHFGDENGNTRYQTGVVLFNGKQVTVLSASTLLANVNLKESGGIFFRSASRFILLGRTHTGDENGKPPIIKDISE